jgi:hypothetical protein
MRRNATIQAILVVLLLAGASFACAKSSTPTSLENPIVSPPAEAYAGLRSMILTTDPETVGIAPSEAHPNVWGVLMEFQLSGTPVTLVALADGTTSLYFGNGGGMLGGGGIDDVAKASQNLVALAEAYYPEMTRVTEYPLPEAGAVQFYLLTFAGIYTAMAPQVDLVSGEHHLSPLFNAGNEVITQFRLQSPGAP